LGFLRQFPEKKKFYRRNQGNKRKDKDDPQIYLHSMFEIGADKNVLLPHIDLNWHILLRLHKSGHQFAPENEEG